MLAAVAQYPPPYNAPGPYGTPPPPMPAADRVRSAWQQRYESDYIFSFWTAFGWTLLTCGIYGFYVLYQQMRRSRDHNRRRVELLDAAMTFAWEQAHEQGKTEQVRPAFERMAPQMAVLRQQTTEFRDPALWVVIDIVTGGIARFVAYVFLDMDLVTHDHAEGAIEAELSQVYAELGTPLTPPDPGRLKGRHNYVGPHHRNDCVVRHLRALVAVRPHGRGQPSLRTQLAVGRLPRGRCAATTRRHAECRVAAPRRHADSTVRTAAAVRTAGRARNAAPTSRRPTSRRPTSDAPPPDAPPPDTPPPSDTPPPAPPSGPPPFEP